MKVIEIIVRRDGSVVAESTGYVGKSCEEATSFLLSLGKSKQEAKAEYYLPDLLGEKVQNGR